MRAKNIIYGILAIILGLAFTVIALSSMAQPSQVTCGGQVMSQGDMCDTYSHGVATGTRNYDQQKQKQQGDNIWMLILGPILVLGGIIGLASGGKSRRRPIRPIPGAYPGAQPPYQPGMYPPPQYPQQWNYPQQPGMYPPPQYPPQGAYPPPQGYPPQQPGMYPPPRR